MTTSTFAREIKLIVSAGSVYLFYILYGLLQERITQTDFDGERFPSIPAVIAMQCAFSVVLSAVILRIGRAVGWSEALRPRDVTPWRSYWLVSVSYLGAMLCSNMSLAYVDYPTSVLAKSCKPIPVLLMGTLVSGKRHPLYKYILVALITTGVAMFMYNPHHAAKSAAASQASLVGYAYLFGSLALDSVTGPYQEHILASYRPSSMQVMFYSNICASVIAFSGLAVLGHIAPVVRFCSAHPEVVVDIALMCVCSALGQVAIYAIVEHFSSLVCSMITTTRKFFTILASVLWYGHALRAQQWLAVALVFGGLGADVYCAYALAPANKREQHATVKPLPALSTPVLGHAATTPTKARRTPSPRRGRAGRSPPRT